VRACACAPTWLPGLGLIERIAVVVVCCTQGHENKANTMTSCFYGEDLEILPSYNQILDWLFFACFLLARSSVFICPL